jgi:hypothetical protein
MAEKRAPIGICDQCGEPIPAGEWYTSKGRPRLHCSITCRQLANSRAGAPLRSKKAKIRVARGEWINPARLHPPDPAMIAAGISQARKTEVAEGRWRNPALTSAARKKLSRPRKHSGALHRAIEKLKQGIRVADLAPSEQAAHRAYRRQLRLNRLDEARRYRREYDRRRWAQMTPEEREAQRARWRLQNKRKALRIKT